MSLYESAREAVCQFQPSLRRARSWVPAGSAADPARARAEAARRAATKSRRYCAANGLDRLWTLTYRGAGCHDTEQLREDVGRFFRALRAELGGKPFPYLWVPEWHRDHGLHVHFGMGAFVHRSKVRRAWQHGFEYPKRLTVPHGGDEFAARRQAARYLSKYVAKTFASEHDFGRHRYEVAQGFQPVPTLLSGSNEWDLLRGACDVMGRAPVSSWSSDDQPDWQAPPTRTFLW
ncbi:rolling circle replication-associated protein [Aeromicrobium duanguangcaii]|uniref:rolling circle replication-associated protein n=1 Tax=Aeromicrobium duanguangcaii TaxID=2968086 RepID=UPI0020182A56|nr:hypothetical protein [Aeromicrobium duanguangcaii]MCL3838501.1 hypothetical protein [Aeromicrobium duanguangcaii]